jgi:dienelactone hydrolase
MCLGGHLSFRCAFSPYIQASVCFFPTDIHSKSLGRNKQSDTLERAGEIQGEVLMIFGKQDPHIPKEGRLMIYKALNDLNIDVQWCEFNAQHAFIRDEGSKGRFDDKLTSNCFALMFDIFHRKLQLGMLSNIHIAPDATVMKQSISKSKL